MTHVVFGIGLFVSILTVCSLLGRRFWMLDVLSHFHIQYTLVLIFALVGLLILRRWRSMLLIPALIVNLWLLAPFFIPNGVVATPAGQTPLRVIGMNISTANAGYPQVVERIRERKPDIVFLSEVRNDLVTLLQTELGDEYPMQYAKPSRFTLGVAILARDPSVVVQTVTIDQSVGRMSRHYLRADFVWEEGPVSLAGIHPLPPLRAEWADSRDREIGLMAQLGRTSEYPFVLIGDLNASPWSHAMRTLKSTTELRYANDGYGIWPTWFIGSRAISLFLGAPLDHILVSPEWAVVGYTEEGDIGSDHVPVEVDLVLNR